MTSRHTVAIVGTGFMGASVGLALADQQWDRIGWDARTIESQAAQKVGAIDEIASGLDACVAGADVVIVCVPVVQSLEVIRLCAQFARTGAIITDVGSVQSLVHEYMVTLSTEFPQHIFVAGHPMCGGAVTGAAQAQSGIFADASWFLSPLPDAVPEIPELLLDLVEACGARPELVTASEHDRQVALTSHLPHEIAQVLLRVAESRDASIEKFMAGGWASLMIRANHNPEMWADIARANGENIATAIDAVVEELQQSAARLRSSRTR